MLQPPQRKQKPVEQLSTLLKQQADKLAARGRQIVDTLEDIRSLGKQKYELEKQYAEALLKLTRLLLSRKDNFPLYGLRTDSEANRRTVSSAWRTVLEETQTMAWQRVKAAESYNSGVCEPCQRLKDRVTASVKKGLDQLKILQDDLTQSTKEMVEYSKRHFETETESVDALNKLNEENSRLQKNPRQSTINLGKLRDRREANALKATMTRNSYLIEWAAVNAHLLHYHETQLPDIYKMLDPGVFTQISSILNALAKADEDVSTATSVMQKKVQECASSLDYGFDVQCFLDGNSELDEPLQFDSDATCDGQSVMALTTSQNSLHQLNQEARKWAGKVVTEEKTLKQLLKKLQQQPQPSDTLDGKKPTATLDNEIQTARDKLSLDFQKSKIAITKARARLDLLKAAGIDVDSVVAEALPSKSSGDYDTGSIHSSSSDSASKDTISGGSLPGITITVPSRPIPVVSSQPPAVAEYPQPAYKVRALFSHEPRVPDELRLIECAIYTVLGSAHDDGWVKAQDAQGSVGFLPLNYVERLSAEPNDPDEGDGYAPLPLVGDEDEYVVPHPLVKTEPRKIEPATTKPEHSAELQSCSETPRSTVPEPPTVPAPPVNGHSNVPRGVSAEVAVQPVLFRPPKPAPRPPSTVPSPRPPASFNTAADRVSPSTPAVLLRALCNYVATNNEELSFNEGDRILLIRKDEESGDGFWEGQLRDGRRGVFPSIIVEVEES